ncbi:MAG: bifunctional (p)ppGpp synthetase/guanosine-3',5'-bis(diphosphate) 3'-pyrophosphohydrolase [Chloroflexi bacterium]|nr:bifunctional (p)ppGpp synthetase/guanosine-3',5'-bis(diphosphate) 3'-pyrophosphohydrolase [Chloroflexota bacterium]
MTTELTDRRADPVHPTLDDLRDTAARYLGPGEIAEIERAYQFADRAHEGHLRASGDPYIEHPLAAAVSCADLELGLPVLQAALLHDVVEDCDVSLDELTAEYGDEVGALVDGVTKLGSLAFPSAAAGVGDDQVQAENLRRMFIAMAEDVRVVIVKLADRLHNMRTLDALPPEKQQRIARETMEIYAPLAARLGIWQFKWQLEDLAFRYQQPDDYQRIASQVAARRATRERYLSQLQRKLETALQDNGIHASVGGRVKHIYSIHQKIQKYAAVGKSFSEIYDLLAVRVLVDRLDECYKVLGVLHSLWRPIPGEFDDYIGNPKPSGYQSLHTTVYWTATRPLEIQIRTREMDDEAEFGVAAHWRYKQGRAARPAHAAPEADRRDAERLAWLRQLVDWQGDLPGAREYVETIKSDVFQDQVFVFTPKGELKDMPAGSSPLDFAFRIHTELGYACVGAKVNGRLVALTTPLSNGDVVEIVTSRNSRGPSRDWLNPALGYLKTNHARTKVRQWFRKQQRTENLARGREELEKELRRLHLKLSDVEAALLEITGQRSLDDVLIAIGTGENTAHGLALRLAVPTGARPTVKPVPLQRPLQRPVAPQEGATGVHVFGSSRVMTRFAACCSPLPGDPITGYVTRSRGVTVHRDDCHNVLQTQETERLVEVQWGSVPGTRYSARLRIEGWDRVGFIRDISNVFADEDINIVGLTTHEDGGRVVLSLTVETDGYAQLQRVMHKVDAVRGVLGVDREL